MFSAKQTKRLMLMDCHLRNTVNASSAVLLQTVVVVYYSFSTNNAFPEAHSSNIVQRAEHLVIPAHTHQTFQLILPQECKPDC